MKLKIVSYASQPHPGLTRMVRSAMRFGIWPVVLGMHKMFRSGTDKLMAYHDWVKTADCSHMLFVDGLDVVFNGGPEEILERYEGLGHPIVVAGERGCWPDPALASSYPPCSTPYRFVNSGAWMSDLKSAIQILSDAQEIRGDRKYFEPGTQVDDQTWLADQYLAGRYDMIVDTECRLFQCIWKAEKDIALNGSRLFNVFTGRTPIIIHGNGKSDMSAVCEWLDL